MLHSFKFNFVAGAWLACAGALVLASSVACAQGGPPMVTDDPDTPGDGHWEINVAAMGARQRDGHLDGAVPDADINYGWGDHLQLKIDIPWAQVREAGQAMRSGLGEVNVGVKWRLIDAEQTGYSMSIYPQFLSNWSGASKRRGIASGDRELLMPLEVSTRVGEFGIDGEIGRTLVAHERGNWIAGAVVAHACGSERECMLELRTTLAPHETQTLLNVGMRTKVSESLTLLASAGREFGRRSAEQQTTAFYLGLQWQH